jgi:hypothetical protein
VQRANQKPRKIGQTKEELLEAQAKLKEANARLVELKKSNRAGPTGKIENESLEEVTQEAYFHRIDKNND